MLKPLEPARFPVVAAAAAGLILASCDRQAASVPTPPEPAPSTADRPAPPTGRPSLNRRDLLDAVARAASDYAAGAAAPATDPLVGRTLDISVAFGCEGAEAPTVDGSGDGRPRWSWGPEHQTIRLGLTPGDWTRSALIAGSGQDQWEAVEGFWITRPWMAADGCPSIRVDPLAGGATAPSPQTVGLAAVFTKGGSRLGRRNGRAYAYTVRPAGDAPLTAPADGYRVRLEGRVAAFPDGRAVRCRASSPDQRPVCVAAVQLDRVAFLSADGAALSEWRPG